MARALSPWVINRRRKTGIRDWLYGPRTRLVRGIYLFVLIRFRIVFYFSPPNYCFFFLAGHPKVDGPFYARYNCVLYPSRPAFIRACGFTLFIQEGLTSQFLLLLWFIVLRPDSLRLLNKRTCLTKSWWILVLMSQNLTCDLMVPLRQEKPK